MQDILAESKLSAGGVYLYFKSKEEIIEAIALETISAFTKGFENIISNEQAFPLDMVLEDILALMVASDQEKPLFGLALQIWAIMRRMPRILAIFNETQLKWEVMFRGLIERYQANGQLEADVPASDITQVIFALIMGFVTKSALLGTMDTMTFRAGVRALLRSTIRSVDMSESRSNAQEKR